MTPKQRHRKRLLRWRYKQDPFYLNKRDWHKLAKRKKRDPTYKPYSFHELDKGPTVVWISDDPEQLPEGYTVEMVKL